MANIGKFKGYGKGFKAGDSSIQREPRPRILLKIGISDIAGARGCHKDTVKRAIQKGILDPIDLKSVAEYICGGRKDGKRDSEMG